MAGRGVDILLGGNPEGLAEEADVLKAGYDKGLLVEEFELPMPIDQMPEEFQVDRKQALALYEERFAVHKAECAAEGDQVREPRRAVRSSGPSVTTAAASTTSSAVVRAARATPVSPASSSASKTT